MPKRAINKLRWKAKLLVITEGVDEYDRPYTKYEEKRDLFYEEIGTTSQEKYLGLQAKRDVVRRIKIRFDKTVTESTNAVRIDSIDYMITRIFVKMENREMELSLAYVD
ncbi:phage head closure protein [Enterococcus sp. AZ102]|uniref:phage head closure protein n=1 Tax=Enterococcus sp. AZ102 TaxID=2774865 RepID=UPI003F259EB2